MKKFIFSLVVLCLACVAQSETLRWQVTTGMFETEKYLSTLDKDVTYYTQIRYGTGEDPLLYNVVEGDDAFGAVGDKIYSVDLSVVGDDPASMSYYIEILKYANNEFEGVARTAFTAYSDLSTAGYIGEPLNPMAMSAWTGAGTYTVPEPTSALMMMLGVAFLGLKRRRV